LKEIVKSVMLSAHNQWYVDKHNRELVYCMQITNLRHLQNIILPVSNKLQAN